MTTIPLNPIPLNQHHLHLAQVFCAPDSLRGFFLCTLQIYHLSVLQTVIFSRKLCWQGRCRPIHTNNLATYALLFLYLAPALRRAEGAHWTWYPTGERLGQ